MNEQKTVRTRHFPYKSPKFGTKNKPAPKGDWRNTVFYWWWAYLKRNDQYIECCESGGKGKLAKLYADITKRYYGHDQQVCVVDDYVAHEWSMIPHFYRDFYVFQYATSFTASEALAAKVKTGQAGEIVLVASGVFKVPEVDKIPEAVRATVMGRWGEK